MRADPYIAHGHTLGAVDTLARHAVMGNRSWWSGGDVADQMDTARFAILERLYTAEEAPGRLDLIQTAQRALLAAKEADMRFHHIPINDRNTGANAAKYWYAAVDRSPEDRIVEVLALYQIVPMLYEPHQRALLALAAAGDYRAAAELLGVGEGTFQTWITRGRGRFRELWHEHETPSKPWGRARRAGAKAGTSKQVKSQNSAAARVRKLRRQAESKGTPA